MKDPITTIFWWTGLDVHADRIQGAVFRGNEQDPLDEFEIVNDSAGLGRLVRKLKALVGKVGCVYEAGPCGYELHRQLKRNGIACDIAAPSLISRKPGDRVKTDRRDAVKLGRSYRSGDLTTIRIPSEEEEAVRDLVRAREDAKEDVTRRRHRLGKFLLRHGHRYRDGRAWTNKHSRWLGEITLQDPHTEAVLEEYRIGLPLILLGSGLASALIFGVTPYDGVSVFGALVILLGVGAVGAIVPALRAAAVDPAVTLRHEQQYSDRVRVLVSGASSVRIQ